MRYRMVWQDKVTGEGGCSPWMDETSGQPFATFKIAADWRNREIPAVHHWVEIDRGASADE